MQRHGQSRDGFRRRALALMMSVVLVFSTIPTSAFAEVVEEYGDQNTASSAEGIEGVLADAADVADDGCSNELLYVVEGNQDSAVGDRASTEPEELATSDGLTPDEGSAGDQTAGDEVANEDSTGDKSVDSETLVTSEPTDASDIAGVLELDKETTVNYEGTRLMYSFVAPTTGLYSFSSSGSYNTEGLLYADATRQQIIGDATGNGAGYNFIITTELTEGATYYLVPSIYPSSNSGSFTIKVSKTPTSGVCGDNLSWSLDASTGALAITGGGAMHDYKHGESPFAALASCITSISLPSGLTTIGDYAFEGCSDIDDLIFPDSLTSIGESSLPSLKTTSINLPGHLQSIGKYAFHFWNNVRSLNLPDSVTFVDEFSLPIGLTSITIGAGMPYSQGLDGVLREAGDLRAIEVSTANQELCAIDGVLYSKDQTTLYMYPRAKRGASFTIPSTVTTLGRSSFEYNKFLTSIVVPASVSTVGYSSFYRCSALTELAFAGDAPTAGSYSFGSNSLAIWAYFQSKSGWGNLRDSYTTSYGTVWKDLDSLNGVVSLSYDTTSVAAGEFFQLNATVNRLYASDLVWSSSDTGIATVADGGLVYGVAPGTATITVADSTGNYQQSVDITVTGSGSSDTPAEKTYDVGEKAVTYTRTGDVSLQIPCEALNGVYLLDGNNLSYYSYATSKLTAVRTFANCKDAFVQGNYLYVIDNGAYVYRIDLPTMASSQVYVSDDITLTQVAADSSGNLLLSGYADSNSNPRLVTVGPSGEVQSTYVPKQAINNLCSYNAESGTFYEEVPYNWVYWGYDHEGVALYEGTISEGTLTEVGVGVDISTGGLSRSSVLFLYQNYYMAHGNNAEQLNDRYLAVYSTAFGTLYVIDTQEHAIIIRQSVSAGEYLGDDEDPIYNTTSIGTRTAYNAVRDSILVYTGGNVITEFSAATGKRLSTFTAAHNVFSVSMDGGTLLLTEKDGDKWLFETVDYSNPTQFSLNASVSSLEVGQTLQLAASFDRAYIPILSWSSSDLSVASVTSTGVVVGWKRGEATVTAQDSAGLMSTFTATVTESSADTGTSANEVGGAVTDNMSRESYSTWSSVVGSCLYEDKGGHYVRVESGTDGINVDTYDSSYKLLNSATLSFELPLFGGFYAGETYNYLVFGQENPSEDDSVEVMRVVKYDKNWNRLASCSMHGENTFIPFDGGSLRMEEAGGYLYVYTCHEMYQSSDGYHHQANMTYCLDVSTMSVTSSYSGVMNQSYGYVSHSFNQFIRTDGSFVYRVDHGDGYPRGVAISKTPVGGEVTKPVAYGTAFSFAGRTGSNATGASVGGLDLSSSNCLIVGNSVDQDADNVDYSSARNVFLLVTDKDSLSTKVVWLSNYAASGSRSAYTPQIVKLGDEAFLVMWEEWDTTSGGIAHTWLATVDGSGNVINKVASTMRLSDCQPIMCSDGSVRWYVTNGSTVTVYQVNPYHLENAGVSVPFIDVSSSTPHEADILWLAASGVTTGYDNGDGTRRYEGMTPVYRQDMAAFLHRLAVLEGYPGAGDYVPSDGDRARFADVDESTPHAEDIWWLAREGISTGYDNGDGTWSFGGMTPVYRQDMAAFLCRLAKASPEAADPSSALFADRGEGPTTSHYDEVAWLYATGVSTGYGDGTFGGMTAVYRQDMAAFLHRMAERGLVYAG